MGPPISKRVSKDMLKSEFSQYGYKPADEFDLGENLYLISFTR